MTLEEFLGNYESIHGLGGRGTKQLLEIVRIQAEGLKRWQHIAEIGLIDLHEGDDWDDFQSRIEEVLKGSEGR